MQCRQQTIQWEFSRKKDIILKRSWALRKTMHGVWAFEGELGNDEVRKCKNGDKEAREEFINGNLRLVLSVVQRFGGRRRKCR